LGKGFSQITAKFESIRKFSSREEVHHMNCTDARINGLPLRNQQSCKNQTTANQLIEIPLEKEVKVGFFRGVFDHLCPGLRTILMPGISPWEN
jgi:hypothetical protein